MSLKNLIDELNLEKSEKILTPLVNEFLATTGNIVVDDEDIQKKLIEIVSDNSNSIRTNRFGASSRGV